MPPIQLSYDAYLVEAGIGAKAGRFFVILTGNVLFTWGDVIITSDKLTVEREGDKFLGEAIGNVRIQRGDELLQGNRFIFDGNRAVFTADSALALSPPFSVRGSIQSDPEGIRATQAIVSLAPNGRGEINFQAEEVRLISAERRLTLRNARISLWGARLFTVSRLSVPMNFQSGDTFQQQNTTPPISFRASGISGTAVGLGGDFTPFRRIRTNALLEFTSRQGIQGQVSTRYEIQGQPGNIRSRRDVSLPGGVTPEMQNTSPLRRLLTARPLPPPYHSVLDFMDIAAIPNPLSDPTRYGIRNAEAFLNLGYNQEFAGRRQGPLLLSRLPEARLVWNLPLAPVLPVRDNSATENALRKPRFTLQGEASLGRYREVRINEESRAITSNRIGAILGVGTLPVLVGKNVLLSALLSYQASWYDSDLSYRFWENSLSAEWVLGRRIGLGASFIRRTTQGVTPFFFDSVDTQNEVQLRGISPIGNSRYTISTVLRYDTAQSRLFDWEVTLGVRGNILEPRFSYRHLNSQFGFTIGIPGLVGL
jgi:hypothetical protein